MRRSADPQTTGNGSFVRDGSIPTLVILSKEAGFETAAFVDTGVLNGATLGLEVSITTVII